MRSETKRRLKRDRQLYIMLLPVLLFFFIWHYIPMWGARIAFQDMRYIGANEWVGLKHFKMLFSSPVFFRVFMNTVTISTMKIILIFPLPIFLAFSFNELRGSIYRNALQSVIYIPHFLSWVVISGIFISLLASPDGVINQIITLFGGDPVSFMTSTRHIRWVFVFSEAWRSIGWDSILYIAAINSISQGLYDAATVDGASKFQQAMKITLPSIAPTIITMFILNLGFFMNAGFDQVFNMMNDAVINHVDIIDTYVYRVGLTKGNFSLGTAAGLFKGVIGIILILGTDKISRKISGEGVW
ncbi:MULTISPECIES: sugar ABC transporter permease [unclassified Oceanispirochaeta]|uniref:ABC transporter permease n=1 Tax=unclassified Oceanispirochaeta TaxID=2635722 RepID=UPI000E08E6E4|nr:MULTISPECIES: ABC transporter permease subunit [unclassified Oceanispirochaeta]MBF9018527.1 sugar ABC transporter permease [Oceanispirochaeta sp. M2]NPD74934.1 sugar ABC transporter permease [Oceanispirochaeta sp. M1]RDG29215.1 sugar ABC transporter permease [Oceanispirochaeta sp. M1]